jgi:hypothetical protein
MCDTSVWNCSYGISKESLTILVFWARFKITKIVNTYLS